MTDDSPSDVNYDRAVMALEDRVWTNEPDKARMTALENLNAVPIEELEQLADEWHNSGFHNRREDRHRPDEVEGLMTAAQELRELVENHR